MYEVIQIKTKEIEKSDILSKLDLKETSILLFLLIEKKILIQKKF
jgi:hypothetical protein